METYLLFEFYEYDIAGGVADFKNQYPSLDDAKTVAPGGRDVSQEIVRATFAPDSRLAFTIVAHRKGDAEWTTTEQAASFTEA